MASFALVRLEPDDSRPPFDCGDANLNEFFAVDSAEGGRELLTVTYSALVNGDLAAFFSVSNDSLRRDDCRSSAAERRLLRHIPRHKRYRSLPAVKIGRLAVSLSAQAQGVGSDILDFVKAWFTTGNKTGCRFVIVDAYNRAEITRFYARNGFSFLLAEDAQDTTRLMYFDLATFKPK